MTPERRSLKTFELTWSLLLWWMIWNQRLPTWWWTNFGWWSKPSLLSDQEYHQTSDQTLQDLTESLETLVESGHPKVEGWDVDYSVSLKFLRMGLVWVFMISLWVGLLDRCFLKNWFTDRESSTCLFLFFFLKKSRESWPFQWVELEHMFLINNPPINRSGSPHPLRQSFFVVGLWSSNQSGV